MKRRLLALSAINPAITLLAALIKRRQRRPRSNRQKETTRKLVVDPTLGLALDLAPQKHPEHPRTTPILVIL
jgi:hypothetical protein